MHAFKDNVGRTWILAIHVAAVKKVRGLLGLDLYALVDDRFQRLGNLLADPVALVDLLFVLCQDDANRLGVSDEDFGRAMGGDVIEAASMAFLEELVDFFPQPRVRAGLRKVIEAGLTMRESLLTNLESGLATLDPETEARRLIALFGSSPGSSESTPAR